MNDSPVTPKYVFDQYTDDVSFRTTKIPLHLMIQCDGELVSRSQAKRVANGFDKFSTVILDFTGVESIGQGFADELFRVFQRENPNIKIVPLQMNEEVSRLVSRILNAANSQYGPLPES